MGSDLNLPWKNVSRFVRQNTHDIRNHLNSLDLEAALLADIVGNDPEALESVTRLRGQIRALAGHLKSLSSRVADPVANPAPFPAKEMFLVWQEQADSLENAPQIEWVDAFESEMLNVDALSMAPAFSEILTNARDFRENGSRLHGVGRIEEGRAIYELREPRHQSLETEGWGIMPLNSSKAARYGLGLFMVRRTAEANGGTSSWSYSPETKELVTRIAFPVA